MWRVVRGHSWGGGGRRGGVLEMGEGQGRVWRGRGCTLLRLGCRGQGKGWRGEGGGRRVQVCRGEGGGRRVQGWRGEGGGRKGWEWRGLLKKQKGKVLEGPGE